MRFRPCIDIHDGKVKQIVGGTLSDSSGAAENFVAEYDADYFAKIYHDNNLRGGHIILLNKAGTAEYDATKKQALKALSAFPNGMQIGGGITAANVGDMIQAGASHVIVTSYIFDGNRPDMGKLKLLTDAVGKEHIVIDFSCRKKDGKYYVVTDRWQTFTSLQLNEQTLSEFSNYCDEFLIHGVDVEGMRQGIDEELLMILGKCNDIKITYAGGVRNLADIDIIYRLGGGKVDFTVGSALNLFGGSLDYKKVIEYVNELNG